MSALVVKIGGSLWRSPDLPRWIDALRSYPGPLTLVPGGGPFADAVRAAQPALGFSDRAAHEMALLAMEQYGVALADRFPRLALAETPREASAIRAMGKIVVWRPRAMVLASDVPPSWDVTSDSLAAWYAHEAGAVRLLLIKSVDFASDQKLRDLVDARFEDYARGLEALVAGPRQLVDAADMFARDLLAKRCVAFPERQRKTA